MKTKAKTLKIKGYACINQKTNKITFYSEMEKKNVACQMDEGERLARVTITVEEI